MQPNPNLKSGRSQTGRSFEPKWTVRNDSGGYFEPKRSESIKVDQKYQSGRSERVKVDGPKVSNQMVRKCQTLTLNALILIAL